MPWADEVKSQNRKRWFLVLGLFFTTQIDRPLSAYLTNWLAL